MSGYDAKEKNQDDACILNAESSFHRLKPESSRLRIYHTNLDCNYHRMQMIETYLFKLRKIGNVEGEEGLLSWQLNDGLITVRVRLAKDCCSS